MNGGHKECAQVEVIIFTALGFSVIPVQTGIQAFFAHLDSRFRGSDDLLSSVGHQAFGLFRHASRGENHSCPKS